MLEDLSTTDLIDHFYQPGVGAATYATKRIKANLLEVDEPSETLYNRAQSTLRLLEIASARRYDWDNKKRLEPLRRQGASNASHRVTAALRSLMGNLQSYEEFEADTDYHRHATGILENLMPQGLVPFTQSRFEEKHNKVKELLRRLKGPYDDAVGHLNLGVFVDRLEAVNREFGTHLSDQNASGVTYDEVQAAESEATEAYFELLLLAWAEYIDDPRTRNTVLQPAEEQNRRIGNYYRQRSRAPEIDPETGDIIGPDEPLEPVADDEQPTPQPLADPAE